jgi:hypothetical protein
MMVLCVNDEQFTRSGRDEAYKSFYPVVRTSAMRRNRGAERTQEGEGEREILQRVSGATAYTRQCGGRQDKTELSRVPSFSFAYESFLFLFAFAFFSYSCFMPSFLNHSN